MVVKELPLVSIMLLTYNQEKYIGEALVGVASQDYPNLEIIISDDNSNDNTRNIIEEFSCNYNGPHKIICNYNCENLGLVRHFNKVISMVSGVYIVLAAGDDISFRNRTSLSVREIRNSGVDSLALNFMYIDGAGTDMHKYAFDVSNKLEVFKLSDYIGLRMPKPSGPSRIISRKLFDVFGPFMDDCPTEDTTLSFRALLLSGIAHYGEIGVKYRWHGNNISAIDNMYKNMDPIKIYNQYYSDLCVAKDKCLVSYSEYKSIKKIIDSYKFTQIFIRELYVENSSFKRHLRILRYLFNPKVLQVQKKNFFLTEMCPYIKKKHKAR
ncbi:MAG: glycosyltransferase [Bacteroidales bacterium]|nr:glycosyltransferase [Bacteroidales bacterium]